MKGCNCTTSGELGVALSGGGARALAQVGVLKVLEREDIPVSYMAGTSGGAVIGAVYATSANAAETEDRVLDHLRTTRPGFNAETFAGLLRPDTHHTLGLFKMARSLWQVRRGDCLVGGGPMRKSLSKVAGTRKRLTTHDCRWPWQPLISSPADGPGGVRATGGPALNGPAGRSSGACWDSIEAYLASVGENPTCTEANPFGAMKTVSW